MDALARHWPEYLMEAWSLGTFMVSAGLCTVLVIHPASPLAGLDQLLQRALIGSLMGLTAVGIIYSPWGRQSGAHLNPAVTLTFFRLGKVALWDAVFYVVAQILGGLAGVLLVLLALHSAFADPPVAYIATLPGPAGPAVAFVAEALISFGLMLMVLLTTNSARLMRFTGLFFEGLWIYLTAPPLGMLLAVEAYRLIARTPRVLCAKLNHHTHRRCIFRCGYQEH